MWLWVCLTLCGKRIQLSTGSVVRYVGECFTHVSSVPDGGGHNQSKITMGEEKKAAIAGRGGRRLLGTYIHVCERLVTEMKSKVEQSVQ